MTGGAFSDQAVYNASSGLFTYGNNLAAGINTCINGDCSLPGETTVVGAGCQSSVSVFTVDYDAPSTKNTTKVMEALKPLVITDKSIGSNALRESHPRLRSSVPLTANSGAGLRGT